MHDGLVSLVRRLSDEQRRGRVLEIGSRMVKVKPPAQPVSPIRKLYSEATSYVGIDMEPGVGVDLVLRAERAPGHFGVGTFDTVLTLDSLEHAEDWRAFLWSSWLCAAVGGLFVVTMAAPPKRYHGHPFDYWRMQMPQFKAIFENQGHKLLHGLEGEISIGLIVEKNSHKIDLTAEPKMIEYNPRKPPTEQRPKPKVTNLTDLPFQEFLA